MCARPFFVPILALFNHQSGFPTSECLFGLPPFFKELIWMEQCGTSDNYSIGKSANSLIKKISTVLENN
jgi:hypothetical protein